MFLHLQCYYLSSTEDVKTFQDDKDNDKGCQTDQVSIITYDDMITEKKLVDQIAGMLPKVIKTLKEYEQEDMFLKFNQLLKDRKKPMQNIAYLLFMDLVEWHSLDNSYQMRYSEDVKQFWRVLASWRNAF